MSLYNQLFGINPIAPYLLAALDTPAGSFGRFRDAHLSEDGEHIIVFTRCGGGNRYDYQHVFQEMRKHPNFVEDYDADYDSTYCSFKFTVPEEFKPIVQTILDQTDTTPPMEKFKKMLDDLGNKKKTPETERAMSVGSAILESFQAGRTKVEI